MAISVKLSRQKLLVATTIVLSLVMTISSSLTQPANARQTHNVTIFDFAFHPQILTIQLGDAIIWSNYDSVIYTLWFVYAENQTPYEKIGSEGLSDPILPEETWSWVFDETVKLQYYSFERLWITGNITVRTSTVGGFWIPIDKFALLAPYISLLSTPAVLIVATAIYLKRRKKKQ